MTGNSISPEHHSNSCPCGSGDVYGECCGLYHQGRLAPSPESLMRSRYSAYVLKLRQYLLATWHPDTRPSELTLDGAVNWLGLEVLDSCTSGCEGRVRFKARFRRGGEFVQLSELSSFDHIQGQWFYTTGEATWDTLHPGRNDPCPCGSGKKFKKCCA